MPIATLASAKVTKSSEEITLTKVRTEGFHEIELAVGALPQHEVTEALFTGCSNDEVRIWLALCGETLGDGLDGDALREVLEGPPDVLVLLHQSSHGLGYFGPSAAANSQVDMQVNRPGFYGDPRVAFSASDGV
jgi:hypothetical protein